MFQRVLVPVIVVLALATAAGATLAVLNRGDRGAASSPHVPRRSSEPEVSQQPSAGPLDEALMGALVPEDVRELFRQFLPFQPGLLPDNRFQRLLGGDMTFVGIDGQPVTLRVIAGSIVRASPTGFVLAPNGGGEPQQFSITAETSLMRSFLPTGADQIEPGQEAYVVARRPQNDALFVFTQAVSMTTQ